MLMAADGYGHGKITVEIDALEMRHISANEVIAEAGNLN